MVNPEDPTGGTLTFEWDFTYESTGFVVDDTGPGPVSFVYDDGPFLGIVALRITSTSGIVTVVVENVNVSNVPPTANAGGPYNGEVGTPVVFSASATDPSLWSASSDRAVTRITLVFPR